MVVYEINIDVKTAVLDTYMPWLKKHIQLIANCEGFIDATLCKEGQMPEPKSGRSKFTIHYRVKNFEALQNYLDNHAASMRQEGIDKFNNQFLITRRFFEVDDSFQPQT